MTDHPTPVRVLSPTGMLGAGFPASSIDRGLALGADVLSVDAGSTDSGPYYLGSASTKATEAAVARDLRILLTAAARADIPLIVGSCGTSGTDTGVDWVAAITARVQAEEGLSLPVARIYSEQDPARLKEHLAQGRVHPLPPLGELDPEVLASCTHVVGMMGHHPIVEALRAGARVVLCGRATDTAVAAAYPLSRGLPPGPVWHAAKIVECGGQATTNPVAGGVLATIDATGFTIEPLAEDAACTPDSVAAHMLYETADPYEMREPAGTIDVRAATYTALDERRVRVEGSLFHPAAQHTTKLEGARVTGYQTMSFAAIRDPGILGRIDEWERFLHEMLTSRVQQTLGLGEGDYDYDVRLYGHNAVLGGLEPAAAAPPREVGVMLLVNAADQATATAVAKVANPLLLHLPTRGMAYLPSFAFATSPAEVERGAVYEFALNHVVDSAPTELFRTEHGEQTHA
ncbi:hypothetical protein JOF53_001413 [Crossiella equi]|uniref:Acyclic terpene utilisation N-terminal domain-containing protein n=1 Tax=Crossiella equi TaxID=130796 RepID=A0ABS5A7J4_9PSEU|nr:acyclic terpene utilization AtuA family protein [Crossiella equi]MBP2472541.1 hypothetical protein [Crossiella equi]